MQHWTIEEARAELAYIEGICRSGGDENVPRDKVYDYATMQARFIGRMGVNREDFRAVADAMQDAASAFVAKGSA